MKSHIALWAIPLLGVLAAPAMAAKGHDDGHRYNRADHRIEQRIDRQAQRIKQGVRSGELTHKETRQLRAQHRHIVKLERRLSRDGRLGRHDQRTLHRELDIASEQIRRLKHNDRFRSDRGYGKPYDRGHRDSGWSVGMTLFDRL